ncbi:hypothetical protein H310_09547 [Aphanomyces invadans]|uniref:Uncharacterized protein n=1 Tax=Aphanomyces invadans TaxID=157072 RepID=A0A024TVK4_9STRA|nr:hypothetical protein H310_09547 [Aphanomyces invadans]ETV97656.1 hypothetical protein H310_09547 [Aphanomyces invadans]|eukprot:XP_008873865.1 hypothetical protein H310_09547 [Aphanomyces invadans]
MGQAWHAGVARLEPHPPHPQQRDTLIHHQVKPNAEPDEASEPAPTLLEERQVDALGEGCAPGIRRCIEGGCMACVVMSRTVLGCGRASGSRPFARRIEAVQQKGRKDRPARHLPESAEAADQSI